MLFVIAPLLCLVRNDHDDVFRYRLPEGLALQAHDVQRLLQRHIVQFRADPFLLQIRIVNYRKPCKLADGVEDHLGIVGHLQVDGGPGKRFDFRRRSGHHRLPIFNEGFLGWRLVGAGALRDKVQRFLYFLIGNGTRRIIHLRALEFGEGALQIAFVPQFNSLMDVLLASLKSRLVQFDLEIGVVRIGFCGLQVIVNGGVKILQVFRSHPGFVVLVALWAACKEDSEGNADGNLTPATHGLSGTPSGPKSRLYLPLQSSIRLSNAASDPRSDRPACHTVPCASRIRSSGPVDTWLGLISTGWTTFASLPCLFRRSIG